MKLVKPGLFIGTREDANNRDNLKECNVKRILTVDIVAGEQQRGSGCGSADGTDNGTDRIMRLHVDRLDEPTADLLSSFDRCIQFIDEGIRNNEAVLVHCLSGVSRSVTIVLAYLMKTENLTLDQAITRLKEAYSPDKVNPNPGFLDQLRRFEEMGNRVNESSKVFKQFRLNLLADQIKENGGANEELMSEFLKEATSRNATAITTSDLQQYKCKKCRMTLFQSTSIFEHEPSQGSHSFRWQKSTNQTPTGHNDVECQHSCLGPSRESCFVQSVTVDWDLSTGQECNALVLHG